MTLIMEKFDNEMEPLDHMKLDTEHRELDSNVGTESTAKKVNI